MIAFSVTVLILAIVVHLREFVWRFVKAGPFVGFLQHMHGCGAGHLHFGHGEISLWAFLATFWRLRDK